MGFAVAPRAMMSNMRSISAPPVPSHPSGAASRGLRRRRSARTWQPSSGAARSTSGGQPSSGTWPAPDAWPSVARERGVGYRAGDTGGRDDREGGPSTPVTLAELRERGLAIDGVEDLVALGELAADAFAEVDLREEVDAAINDAAVALHRVENRLAGVHLRVLRQLAVRHSYRDDGAVTAASWLRARTHMDSADSLARCEAARRLEDLPELRAALEAGATSWRHVQSVTAKCVPDRAAAFAEADAVLARLARAADPRAIRVAVKRLVACIDPDGTEDPEDLPTGPRDPRRELFLHPTIDGLWSLAGTLDTLTGEKLAALIDALEEPDPTDTPPARRRSPAQRRHDAFEDLLDRATGLDGLPTVHGRPPHMLGMVDLLAMARLAGVLPDGIAADAPAGRLRYSGPISAGMVLHLLTDAAFTLVQTQGPGRVANVGRRMRTLPDYLRDVLQLLHLRCRGPDCDRLVTWSEAHHLHAFADGGDTDLNASIPVCKAHHQLMDVGWDAALDLDSLVVTWTTPTGRTIAVRP
jgi:hypothetical protein